MAERPGFLMANDELSPFELGDEPLLIFKIRKKVSVAVGEKRTLAIPEIIFHKPETELICMMPFSTDMLKVIIISC